MIGKLAVALVLTARLHAQSVAFEGRLIDAERGKPLAEAVVTLWSDEGNHYMAETDHEGRVHYDLVPGRYRLAIRKEGYDELLSPPAPIMVLATSPVTSVNLHAVPLGVISGHVLDADGDPLIGVSVAAMMQRVDPPLGEKKWFAQRSTTTNDLGEFRMFNVPPRQYYLRASHAYDSPQFSYVDPAGNIEMAAFAATYYPGATNVAQASRVTLRPGGELHDIDIRMAVRRLAVIRGQISGLKLLRLNAASVRFDITAGFVHCEFCASVDADGRYVTRPLPPGSQTITVTVTTRDAALYGMKAVELDGQDVDGVEVPVAPPPQPVRGPIELFARFQVEGTAPGKTDELDVYLTPDSGVGGATFSKNADATRSAKNLPAGKYVVHIDNFRGMYLKAVRLGSENAADNRIDVQGPGTVTLVLGTDLGRVNGSVLDAAGKPVVGAVVTLVPDQSSPDWYGSRRTDYSDLNGDFTLRGLIPGPYHLYASTGAADPDDLFDKEYRKPHEDLGVAMTVEAGRQGEVKLKLITIDPERRP
jgi:protocatechuate 3,4-dioxygenase beta subunit